MKCVLYLRSSKDRADIAVDTQRKELLEYALSRGWEVAKEFADSAISGSLDTASRPGYAALVAEVSKPRRGWDGVLALDSSRIARDMELQEQFRKLCARNGVSLHIAHGVNGTTPEHRLYGRMQTGIDVYHAEVSREKGRKGLEENFAQGYRNGGRAPAGYKLEHTQKGTATRDGKPVMKSRLVVDSTKAPAVQAFLRSRAAGTPRAIAAKAAGLVSSQTSLLSLERNALTYTGHTVWNARRKHKPSEHDRRKTMLWNPRDEWKVSEEATHEGLITRQEADAILADLDLRREKRGRPQGRQDKRQLFALGGMLATPDGRFWKGDGDYYRLGKGVRVRRDKVEDVVFAALSEEIASQPHAAQIVNAARQAAQELSVDVDTASVALRSVERRLDNIAEEIAEYGGSAALRDKLRKLEAERDTLATAVAEAELRNTQAHALEARAQDYVASLEFFRTTPEPDREFVRGTLLPLVERIELDEQGSVLVVHYRHELKTKPTSVGFSWRPHGDLQLNPVWRLPTRACSRFDAQATAAEQHRPFGG